MALSDTAVRNAKPGDRPRKLFDSGKEAARGLFVLITPATPRKPAGSKLWRLRYWIEGKERLAALGSYPEVSLAEARAAAQEQRKLLGQRIDPVAAKRAHVAAEKRAARHTFRAFAQRWLADGAWIPATHRQYARLLERDILPELGDRVVDTLTRAEINDLVKRSARPRVSKDALERRKLIGGVISARHVRQIIASVLDDAIEDGVLSANPAVLPRKRGTKKKARQHTVTPYRHLDAAGLATLLSRLDAYQGTPETRAALRLQLLCFTRPSELRLARWSEFALDATVGPIWNVPAERMKGRRPHDVPLSVQAVAVLRDLHARTAKTGWLFPNTRDSRRPMGPSTLQRALGYLDLDASPHGFRHSASTILHDQGFDTLVIERQLAHADRNPTRAAYNRATYIDERRRMLQHWADWLDALAAGVHVGANVVGIESLRSGRASATRPGESRPR